jgi:hypothetical protein
MQSGDIGSELYYLEKYHDSSDKPITDRKNIKHDFKKNPGQTISHGPFCLGIYPFSIPRFPIR